MSADCLQVSMNQNANITGKHDSASVELSLVPALKLTVFIGGDEQHSNHPLIDDVFRILHETGAKGATVTKGVMSFGTRRRIHSLQNEITMENLPLIVEAIGEVEMIRKAAQMISELIGEHGLVELVRTTLICGAAQNKSE